MTEADWLACTDAPVLLNFLSGKGSDRKWRLYACGCCRAVWHLLTEEQSRRAVVVAEAYAEGKESRQALAEAHRQAIRVAHREEALWCPEGAKAAASASHTWKGSSPWGEAIRAARALQSRGYGPVARWLVHDVFGNPFRPPLTAPTCNTADVRVLAAEEAASAGFFAGPQDHVRLKVLSDALEEAGCTDEYILAHLRERGPHVRGCHVLDLIVGKTPSG